MTCIGEPISWPRLERFARTRETREPREPRDAETRAHLDACPACAACFAEIASDLVALPALPAAPARRRRWTWFAAPAFALAAAIAILVLVGRRDDEEAERYTGIKGDAFVVDVVRERDGAIAEGARTFLPGDRWKVLVTCPPGPRTIAVTVEDGLAIDRPLAPAAIACGNRVALPGAFTLTGDRPNRICIAADDPRLDRACVTVAPE